MRFALIDRVVDLEPGVRISATKSLTMAEEYLADHFPLFPVMPGVLMLQAMTDASSWLIRATDDFAQSMIVLREAANVKYAQFLEPGQTLMVSAEIQKREPGETKLRAKGVVEGRTIVSCRLVLAHYNLADRDPHYAATDRSLRRHFRDHFLQLHKPAAALVAAVANGANGANGADPA
jgi:3-hydroxyacyl-[acyl-carrier-protein] dehydratase